MIRKNNVYKRLCLFLGRRFFGGLSLEMTAYEIKKPWKITLSEGDDSRVFLGVKINYLL